MEQNSYNTFILFILMLLISKLSNGIDFHINLTILAPEISKDFDINVKYIS